MFEAVETLAENLLASEPFVAFEQAYARFEADPQASGLMRKLTRAQTNLRTHQSNGGLSQADIAQFRALQMETQANRLIGGYIETQDNATAYLKEINQEISQWLGVDFAALARRQAGEKYEVLGSGGLTVWNGAGKTRYTAGSLPSWGMTGPYGRCGA